MHDGPHHHHHHGHDHGHAHAHDHAHGPGHNHAHPDHLASHMHGPDTAAELQVLSAQFIDGFREAMGRVALNDDVPF